MTGNRPPLPAWQDEMRRRITSLTQLQTRFPDVEITDAMRRAEAKFPLAITPYYASLIRTPDFSDPVFAQCVPSGNELFVPSGRVCEDPLAETTHSPTPGLVRRYPDRALLLATSACAAYCRHCTRKRVSSQPDAALPPEHLDRCVRYLRDTPEISDVLVSGGDPLTLGDDALARLLRALKSVPSVRVIRIATRIPVTLPARITPALVDILRAHGPVFVNTHFNHPVELTPLATDSATRLIDAGIPVNNQTVLLRGINDTPAIIEDLCRRLFHRRIRPYYLFQCDLVTGIEHFRTPLQCGLDIMRHLRGRLSGLAIPNFAVDTPGAGGKIELLPDCILRRTPDHTVLLGNTGTEIVYPEPVRL